MEVNSGSLFRGDRTMVNPELLDEWAAALKEVETEAEQVATQKGVLEKAREKRNKAQAKVREIEAEIRAQVEGGQSTRPLMDKMNGASAKATFEGPKSPAKSRRQPAEALQ
jgi:hypothetical protein